jgi:hypothetical protein
MPKAVTTRRGKLIHKGKGALEFLAHPKQGSSRKNEHGRSTVGGKLADQKQPGTSSPKDRNPRAQASPSTRGQFHSLASAGRKTTARTQGGATKGSGRKHDW